MPPARAGLFVYAKDAPRLVAFYMAIIGMRQLHSASDLTVLEADGVQLLVHAIPPAIAATIDISVPPEPRDTTALKFFFTVPSLALARRTALQLGGDVVQQEWLGPGFRVGNAIDPEGNIFQLREPA